MAKRKKGKRRPKYPDPIDIMLDFAGAAALGMYTKHKIKRDFEKGEGEESAIAAGMVFGMGSTHGGSYGRINLGGLIGLNSALRDIESRQINLHPFHDTCYTQSRTIVPKSNKYVWRNYCEDGSAYELDPIDFETADDYNDALENAKKVILKNDSSSKTSEIHFEENKTEGKKYIWRKYCEDGSEYGIDPLNFETADDYEDALQKAKEN